MIQGIYPAKKVSYVLIFFSSLILSNLLIFNQLLSRRGQFLSCRSVKIQFLPGGVAPLGPPQGRCSLTPPGPMRPLDPGIFREFYCNAIYIPDQFIACGFIKSVYEKCLYTMIQIAM